MGRPPVDGETIKDRAIGCLLADDITIRVTETCIPSAYDQMLEPSEAYEIDTWPEPGMEPRVGRPSAVNWSNTVPSGSCWRRMRPAAS